MERFEQGDAWVFPDRDTPSPFNWAACAGRAPDQQGRWCFFDDIDPGCYDAKARVEALDLDGVDAELLFPNGLDWVVDSPDRDFHLAMTRIYNDHLSAFCAYAPDRFGGAALRALDRRRRRGGRDRARRRHARHRRLPAQAVPARRRDPRRRRGRRVWAAIEETGKPVAIHVSLRSAASFNMAAIALPGTVHFYDAPQRMLEFIFSGVLDRFPRLQVFLAEIDCGWLPYYAQQCDDNYLRHSKSELRDVKLARMPSEYMKERFPASFITDPHAVENRHTVGDRAHAVVERLPAHHVGLAVLLEDRQRDVHGVPDDERHPILAGNAQRLFGFGS